MIGVYLLVLTVAVIYAALTSAATYQAPRTDQDTIPGTTVPCTDCDQPASTIVAGRPACDDCATHPTSSAIGA
jgi:hypothetical protein